MDDLNRPVIMWFRQDLRLADNPALTCAIKTDKPLINLFILDEFSPDVRLFGAAQKWWLHHSLQSLARNLQRKGANLVLRTGPAAEVINAIVSETGANMIVWNRRYGEGEQAVDRAVKLAFRNRDQNAYSFSGLLMHEPRKLRTGTGAPYKVFTPFWRRFQAGCAPREPLPAPERLVGLSGAVASDPISDWELLPTKPDWSGGISETWTPGEDAANRQAHRYFSNDLEVYDDARDKPGPDRTARLSPYLRFGEISPHQLWHAAHKDRYFAPKSAKTTWLKELVWREFSYHLLQEWPALATANFKPKYDSFPWRNDPIALQAWQQGQTGYPIVDAGMRQLRQTGWMHNRVRMIVASFLIKHLLIDWREGERWFWNSLVDGDPASNPAQWQWVAGSGADAAPFFRIFNPITQAQKFDADGCYIRRYLPELARLPNQFLAAPWTAPTKVLEAANIVLGKNYPKPIIDHKFARERALNALTSLNKHTDNRADVGNR